MATRGPGDTRRLFGRRRRAARMHTAVRVLIAVVVLAVVLGGAWVVTFSSLLAADDVKVTGTDQLTTAEVKAAADVPLGRPLARIDLDAIEERVRTLPLVESVEASRSWPGTVQLRVTERTAVAWIEIDGEIRGVDRFGSDFRSFPEPPQLTEIRVDTNDPRDRQQSFEGLGAVVATLRSSAPDLLGAIRRNFTDANWITPQTPMTGLIFAGFVFWIFCFGMSRYSIYMERRLDTGHRK